MLRQPYLGITGIMHRNDVRTIVSAINWSRYMLMAGILVSERTLLGRSPSTRGTNRYPHVEHIEMLLRSITSDRVLKLIHYSGRQEALPEDLATMHNRWGKDVGGVDGFQFNMAWPDPEVLKAYRLDGGAKKKLVLQIGSRAMDEAQSSVDEVMRRLHEYGKGTLDAVLIDMSGGDGKPFKPDFVAPFLKAIHESDLNLSPVIAGGFGPGQLQHLKELLSLLKDDPKLVANLSTDAEHAVRTNDHLDLNKVRACIIQQQEEFYFA